MVTVCLKLRCNVSVTSQSWKNQFEPGSLIPRYVYLSRESPLCPKCVHTNLRAPTPRCVRPRMAGSLPNSVPLLGSGPLSPGVCPTGNISPALEVRLPRTAVSNSPDVSAWTHRVLLSVQVGLREPRASPLSRSDSLSSGRIYSDLRSTH